jgi:hypothetical protein
MKTETFKSEKKVAYGKTLEKPIPYEFTVELYEDGEAGRAALVAAKDELTLDEQVQVRNDERKSTARQKAEQAALDAAGIVKPTNENDPELRVKNMVKIAMSGGTYKTEAEAEIAVRALLGL